METFIKKTSKYLHEPQQKNLSGCLVSKENGNIVCVQKMAAGSLSFLLYRYGINMGKKKDSNCPVLKVLFLLCKYMLEFRRYTLQCLQNFNSLITFVSHTLMLHSTHAHTHTHSGGHCLVMRISKSWKQQNLSRQNWEKISSRNK